jgi:hypothetical protein
VHFTPHAPQLTMSECRSTQLPWQDVSPALQDEAQVPLVQD